MAVAGALRITLIIRAAQLRPGDLFETLHTNGAGERKENRRNAASYGVPVSISYPGREETVSLHPNVKVRLMERATS